MTSPVVDVWGNPFSEKPVIVMLTISVAYVVFTYFASAERLLPRLSASRGEAAQQARAIHLQRLLGTALLGGAPALVALLSFPRGLRGLGLGFGEHLLKGAPFIALTVFVVLPVVWLTSQKEKTWIDYPQIRAPAWTLRLHLENAITWTIYLIGYEFFFRGFLLRTLEEWSNAWTAVAITTALYVFAHLRKPAAETIGTIPMGVVFALAALTSRSIWIPTLMHVIIAVSSDVFVTRANPAIRNGR